MPQDQEYVVWFENLSLNDVPRVGGKNASLGEMIHSLKKHDINVPDGFATTAKAYWRFLEANYLQDKIVSLIESYHLGHMKLETVGKNIRNHILQSQFPKDFEQGVCQAYLELCRKYGQESVDVAVRSSATAEDLPQASFAGQQETFLNITGEAQLMVAVKQCFASLFTDRAISYREDKGFDHLEIALSTGIQKMVRSDKAGSGVIFSLDTETGFPDIVIIDAAWGLGENVVQGAVTPDEYRVFKPLLDHHEYKPIIEKSLGAKERKMVYAVGGTKTIRNIDTNRQERRSFVLSEEEILYLARWAKQIEVHYGCPMDMEWAKDGESGDLFIVQARPETVQSQKEASTLKHFSMKEYGQEILSGISIGEAIAAGEVCRIKSVDEINLFKEGSILVTGMTDPDWVPIMKKAAGIITDHGGRTCHAAIVSRELGIPAIVGTGHGTEILENGQEITMSCAEGEQGIIYQGILNYKSTELKLEDIPETKTQIMMNIASPVAAYRWWRLPCNGIGLARMEFIINNIIKIHPMALLRYDQLKDKAAKKRIYELTRGYSNKSDYFVEHLSQGIAQIAASQYPNPVIVRMSDFKTNEYANLVGGQEFEPHESNPMLGFRGASRYYNERYREGFSLECQSIRRVRNDMGLTNVIIMIPFCRTLDEADKVLEVLKENDLQRGDNGLEVYVMCEIPSNIVLAREFAKRFDGFSIGSNDLTQLLLGVDRDSSDLTHIFDERNKAVTEQIKTLLDRVHSKDMFRKVGICGQAPRDYPEFASFLVQLGIDSISLNPDRVLQVKKLVAEEEKIGV
ncbi:MAG TPA: phosphoenolpyruvate synthase [Desulfohalobiaceae bacterium]|nr:phosphoenolpyruvate synthase [Desulfohalobiaceae bacterium]